MANTEYTKEQKAHALKMLASDGLAATHKALGIPKSTISKWALAAEVPTASEDQTQKTRAATRASAANRSLKFEETNRRMEDELGILSETAILKSIEIVRSFKPLIIGQPALREVVGAFTRAIHDRQLLHGSATERTEQVVGSDQEIAALRDTAMARLRAVE